MPRKPSKVNFTVRAKDIIKDKPTNENLPIFTARMATKQLNLIADCIAALDPAKTYTKCDIAAHFMVEFHCRGVNPKFKKTYFLNAAIDGVKKKRPSRSDK